MGLLKLRRPYVDFRNRRATKRYYETKKYRPQGVTLSRAIIRNLVETTAESRCTNYGATNSGLEKRNADYPSR